MSELYRIETKAKDFAEARQELSDVVRLIKIQVDAIYAASRKDIRRVLGKVAQRQAELEAMVEANPALFQSPRTLTFSGVKVGYRKGAGKMEWADDAELVALIEKRYSADEAEVLIRTKKTPNAKALEELDGGELKRLGITVEDTGDVVVVKCIDSAVEKAVKALLKNAEHELREDA